MTRNVRGSLFSDYVRMIRAKKGVDWAAHLQPEDLAYLEQRIATDEWYPMATFERLGNAILAVIGGGNLEAVRMWGRITATQLRTLHPELVAAGDPMGSLMRFHVMRSTFFDFEAFEFVQLSPERATVEIHYYMGDAAEEAASHQAMGFFEQVLQTSGATAVWASFSARSWAGDGRTMLELRWRLG